MNKTTTAAAAAVQQCNYQLEVEGASQGQRKIRFITSGCRKNCQHLSTFFNGARGRVCWPRNPNQIKRKKTQNNNKKVWPRLSRLPVPSGLQTGPTPLAWEFASHFD